MRLQRRSTRIKGVLLLVAGVGVAGAELRRFPISPQQVAAALSRPGLTISPDQVQLPFVLLSAAPEVPLELQTIEPGGSSEVRVRLRCSVAGSCSNFLATIAFPQQSAAEAARQILSSSSPRTLPISSSSGPAVRAGSEATLIMSTPHMRIRIPVIALDSARPGTEVRVSSTDHKVLYRGIVSGPGLVEGVVP